MILGSKKSDALLAMIRNGQAMTLRQQVQLTLLLSVPGILAQISNIVMEYIDASMVGSLGAESSAAIGLISTSTWLFWGICSAAATGFSVQVAHLIGAGNYEKARSILRQAIAATFLFSCVIAVIGVLISNPLPSWLGGTESIHGKASVYFLIFAISIPICQLSFLASGMLRCSGNMAIPSALNVLMCLLDVIFNYLLIFPTREVNLLGLSFTMPGAGLDVMGAALGTTLAQVVTAVLMFYFLCFRSRDMRLTHEHGSFRPTLEVLGKAVKIGFPMGVQHIIMCGAQIMVTVIVAPLGNFAIAANAFAVTAEGLCYMPGYGISDAATTLVGQSLGARRRDLIWRFAKISITMGMAIMTIMGFVMYVAAPLMMGIMTPIDEIRELGVAALRIEAFAEPMFAASIVTYGVFVGAGDTLIPSCMNLGSIWAVRLTLAALLAPSMGLSGVWTAMCIELCFRGLIFLIRLRTGKWIKLQRQD